MSRRPKRRRPCRCSPNRSQEQLAALKYIEGYVDQYFCPDGKCTAEERRAYVQQEAEGFLKLAASRSEQAEWAEPLRLRAPR